MSKSLKYHSFPLPGKIEVCPTKSCISQEELSLAYTPGVAEASKEISKKETKYKIKPII